MMMSSPFSKRAMFRPISPSPPRGMIFRPMLSLCAVSISVIDRPVGAAPLPLFLKFYQEGDFTIASGDPLFAGGIEPPHRVKRAPQGAVGNQRPGRVAAALERFTDCPQLFSRTFHRRTAGGVHMDRRFITCDGGNVVPGGQGGFSPLELGSLPLPGISPDEHNGNNRNHQPVYCYGLDLFHNLNPVSSFKFQVTGSSPRLFNLKLGTRNLKLSVIPGRNPALPGEASREGQGQHRQAP